MRVVLQRYLSTLRLSSRGDIPNDLIERPLHFLHVFNWNFDPKLVLDLRRQLGEIKIGIGITGIVPRSHTLPAIAELLNVDFA